MYKMQGIRRLGRRRREGDWRRGVAAAAKTAVAMATTTMSLWPGQGVAKVVAAAMAVGLLPRPSVSSHSRGKRLLLFCQMTTRVCGGGGGGGGVPSPLIEPKMGEEGKGPT